MYNGSTMRPFSIGKRKIGPGYPTFIIAEMSGNHHLDINEAYKIIDAAVEAGADAIKIQTYTADTLTIDVDNEYFRVNVNEAWAGQTLYKLYQKAYTPWDWQAKLQQYAEEKGIIFFSTPFDPTAVDFLEKLEVPLYKVASFEIVDIPLLERIGKTKKPVIMSKGMATADEISLAIKTLKSFGCPQIALLQCISSYPATPEEMNLLTIPDIVKKFGVIAGLSDHTLSPTVPTAAVALGARVIEKHLTLERAQGGPDASFSLEPYEFKEMVNAVRTVEAALGKPTYGPGKKEKESIVFRKSLFVVKDIKKGERITEENVRSIRPGYGLAPKYYHEVMGMVVKKDIARGTPLAWKLISKK